MLVVRSGCRAEHLSDCQSVSRGARESRISVPWESRRQMRPLWGGDGRAEGKPCPAFPYVPTGRGGGPALRFHRCVAPDGERPAFCHPVGEGKALPSGGKNVVRRRSGQAFPPHFPSYCARRSPALRSTFSRRAQQKHFFSVRKPGFCRKNAPFRAVSVPVFPGCAFRMELLALRLFYEKTGKTYFL